MEHTYNEIIRQPLVWREVLTQLQKETKALVSLLPKRGLNEVVFAGCGSSYNLALTAAYFWQRLNKERARGVPSSEVFLFPEGIFLSDGNYLFFGISRSGETTETLRALESFKERFGGITIGITCQENSLLSRSASYSVILSSVVENSIVMTQSFSSMLLSVLFLAMERSGVSTSALMALPDILDKYIDRSRATIENVAANLKFSKFIFLGNGPFYGIAWEGSLKLKEMSLTSTETFHFLEFRHGPKSIVDEETLVIALSSEQAFDLEEKVIQELVALGATVLHLGRKPVSVPSPKIPEVIFEEKNLNDFLTPLLDVVFLQFLGYFRAKKKGLNPDNPKHLDRVVIIT